MTHRGRKLMLRPLIVGLVAIVATALAPGVAHAEPPVNDDFDNATTITSLPFTMKQATTEATKADDDPTSCYDWSRGSVWYRYTAPADGIVRASVMGVPANPIIAVYTGARGALTEVPGACTSDTGPSDTFRVTAGETYHIMLIEYYYEGGEISFDLISMPPSPNDDFAAATVTGLPATLSADLRQASAEPGEAAPTCDTESNQSVWYRYVPDRTRPVSLEAGYPIPSIAVYRGTTPAGLSEVDCVAAGTGKVGVFTAVAGQTYQIRIATNAMRAHSFDLRIRTAPALAPGVDIYPERPSVYSNVSFLPYAGDRLERPIASGEVRFGDGASAPITGGPITHQYATDGEYRVEVIASTTDGRTGTGVRTLKVETHDVSVVGFTVPASSREGETKPVKALIVNTRYDENVQVELQRQNTHGYFERVGVLTQWVPASPRRTVEFPFAYTYTAADAATGKVTFRVVATVTDRWPDGDARPEDNTRDAATNPVHPRTGDR
jgi:hypothetical protein